MFEVYFWATYLAAILVNYRILVGFWVEEKSVFSVVRSRLHMVIIFGIPFIPLFNVYIAGCLMHELGGIEAEN